jgi:hypothetical protein
MKKKYISAQEFDELFDKGEDISAHLDMNTAKREGLEIRRVSVDFPEWMIKTLDREAVRLGVTRQSVIKFWIAEKIRHG